MHNYAHCVGRERDYILSAVPIKFGLLGAVATAPVAPAAMALLFVSPSLP